MLRLEPEDVRSFADKVEDNVGKYVGIRLSLLGLIVTICN